MKKLLALLMAFCLLLSGGCTSNSSEIEEASAQKAAILNNTDTSETASESSASGEASHAAAPEATDEVLVIGENLFTEQINYIYYNPDEYIGKAIQYEGMYAPYLDAEGNDMHVVYRNGPGCCTSDDVVGFEVIYDGEEELKENDWVEVTGTVEYVTHGGIKYLAIQLTDLEIKEERGLETVT